MRMEGLEPPLHEEHNPKQFQCLTAFKKVVYLSYFKTLKSNIGADERT